MDIAALTVPSPLVGEGQGGGCRSGTLSRAYPSSSSLHHQQLAPLPGLPPSLALPHKGGGNAPLLERRSSLISSTARARHLPPNHPEERRAWNPAPAFFWGCLCVHDLDSYRWSHGEGIVV